MLIKALDTIDYGDKRLEPGDTADDCPDAWYLINTGKAELLEDDKPVDDEPKVED